MCRYEEWNRDTHKLDYCPKAAVEDGLCQEHLEWVQDCRDMTGIERKYPYRVPARRAPKLGPSKVKETVEPPSARRLEYVAWTQDHAKQDKGFIQWALDEDKREKAASEPSPYTAHGMAEIQRRKAEHAAMLTSHRVYIGTVPDTRPIGQRTPETNAATVCGFRFEYRAKGGSGFYWNGKRVASTREGLERMGPAVLAKVCR